MREIKDSEERKQEFVDVAEKLFKENGIVDTTVNNIVKELDVAKGLFYYYFKSKDDVIEEISRRYNEAFNAMMQESMTGLTWYEQFDHLIENCMQSFIDMHGKLQGQRDDVDLSQLSLKSWEEAQIACKDAIEKLLIQGNEKGELEIENPSVAAGMIAGGISYSVSIGQTEISIVKQMIYQMIQLNGKGE